MKGKKKAVAVALAALFACGSLAGCAQLTTINNTKNFAQVIAEVDLTRSEDFQEGGDYFDVNYVVGTTKIIKRDMIASFISTGANLMNSYGWSYRDTFNMIADSLVNRSLYVQYAKAFLMKNGEKGDGSVNSYNREAYQQYIGDGTYSEDMREAKSIEYFLSEDERAKAVYDLRVSVNASLDSIEEEIIDAEEDEHEHTADADVRTTPTGVGTENEDYYDPDYRIYTGKEVALGSYEKVDGSTPYFRGEAYKRFLSNLYSNDLLTKGENTSDFESLNYYALELRSAYESAIINKMTEIFEENAEKKITPEWVGKQFESTVATHMTSYRSDRTSFETAFDNISDTSFILAAPHTVEGDAVSYSKYGYVINILLPFSDEQSDALEKFTQDFGDSKGNTYIARAQLLRNLTATDQRSTWFTGHTDYSYVAEGSDGAYTGGNSDRRYLFFEDSLKNSQTEEGEARYEGLKNYYGKYTYNGYVFEKTEKDGDKSYVFLPKEIGIDDFLGEMEGYVESASYDGGALSFNYDKAPDAASYFAQTNYYTDGEPDYSKFVYASGKITGDGAYDPNHIFLRGSWENTAMSVINELSFAYNTDTAGLNTYLGYSVTPYKTSYMAEFEYAAQKAVAGGAGTFYVVPTDYGWHIIYCTFSFADMEHGYSANEEGALRSSPYNFLESEVKTEGTFSYLWYEYQKSTAVSSVVSAKQSEIIDSYADDCSTIYEGRFADLTGMD